MSQICTKFIQDNAVNGAKIRLRNDEILRARNAADTADIDILKVTTADVLAFLREVSLQNNKIIDVADPTAPQDAATKAYVDNLLAGLSDPKDSVRVATTAALPAVTYANGTGGVGATLTANANGVLPSIDGVALSVGQRLLVKDQVAGLENGLYEVTDLGSAGTPFILTRTEDADESSEVTQGLFTHVAEGSIHGKQGFMITTADPITVGTTALAFTQFGEVILAGTGLQKVGSTISVDNGAGLSFSGNQLVVVTDDDLVDGSAIIKTNQVASSKYFKESITLSATDITNQFVDLARVAMRNSIQVVPDCGPVQHEVIDYAVSYLGGTGGVSRISLVGDLATGGNAALVAGDIIYVQYESLDY